MDGNRILMTCIRNSGLCLCPRCKILKSKVHLLGTKSDRKARTTLARSDDLAHRQLVSTARDFIYKKNFDIDSAPVKRLLKAQSLVPTFVSYRPLEELLPLTSFSLIECLF